MIPLIDEDTLRVNVAVVVAPAAKVVPSLFHDTVIFPSAAVGVRFAVVRCNVTDVVPSFLM